ncbi:MAG: DUF4252 domain-containing protein [Ignavibacteria bacterium]|nr:DUF4252 domain-containing protein [Ignavibacteria bacterium]
MKDVKAVILLLLLASQLIIAQQADIKKDPGYFDFSEFTSLKTGEALNEIYIEEALLKMASGMTGNDKEGVGNILSGLKLVRVQEFMVNEKDIDKAGKLIETMDGDLLNKNWVRIIKSRNKESYSNVYVKPAAEGGYCGFIATTLTGKGKAALINVVGKIDLESIGKLSKQFNFPKSEKE